ncbi:MAG: CRTAC1 family protein [Acidobacteriota bacterium]
MMRTQPRPGAPPSLGRLAWGLCLVLMAAVDALAGAPAVQFVDATAPLGIDFRHRSSATPGKYLPETMGSGVAILDFDRDGRLDIFFANGARILNPMPAGELPRKDGPEFSNRLYRQQAGGGFIDVTATAGLAGTGYCTGVAAGDIDNDGYPDLYVGGLDGGRLYRNQGDGTFADITETSGTRGSGWISSVAFLDYDHDGLLDLFVGRYLDWSFEKEVYCGSPPVRAYCSPSVYPALPPLLFRNLGGGRFQDVTEPSGIGRFHGKALGVAVADLDRDGRIDIFVANDGMEQFLLLGHADGTFREEALVAGVAVDQDGNSFAGMGTDVADFDNDLQPDILVTNLSNQSYALYRGDGAGGFEWASDTTGLSQISLLYAGWGFRFIDYDNDGWRDVLITQGHVLDTIEITSPHIAYAQPPFLLKNLEGKAWRNVSAESGEVFSRPAVGRGLAVGDLDNDGDLDVVLSLLDSPAQILLNQGGNRQNWIQFELEGTRSNRQGIGAEVTVTLPDGGRRQATVTTTSSYQSASDPRVHFGLGSADHVVEVEIRWPSGQRQLLGRQPANRLIPVREPG